MKAAFSRSLAAMDPERNFGVVLEPGFPASLPGWRGRRPRATAAVYMELVPNPSKAANCWRLRLPQSARRPLFSARQAETKAAESRLALSKFIIRRKLACHPEFCRGGRPGWSSATLPVTFQGVSPSLRAGTANNHLSTNWGLADGKPKGGRVAL